MIIKRIEEEFFKSSKRIKYNKNMLRIIAFAMTLLIIIISNEYELLMKNFGFGLILSIVYFMVIIQVYDFIFFLKNNNIDKYSKIEATLNFTRNSNRNTLIEFLDSYDVNLMINILVFEGVDSLIQINMLLENFKNSKPSKTFFSLQVLALLGLLLGIIPILFSIVEGNYEEVFVTTIMIIILTIPILLCIYFVVLFNMHFGKLQNKTIDKYVVIYNVLFEISINYKLYFPNNTDVMHNEKSF